MTRQELIAAGKIGLGSARVVSGYATALGHGLLGAYFKNHQMMGLARHVGKQSVDGGAAMAKEGWREFFGK